MPTKITKNKYKKHWTIIFVLFALFIGALFPIVSATAKSFTGWGGEITSPGMDTTYEEIGSYQKLVDYAKNYSSSSKNVILTNNIPLEGKIWTPIAAGSSAGFTKIFNGNGFAIKNMTIDDTLTYSGNGVGFFSKLGDDAVVQDLRIEYATIISNKSRIGIVAGEISGTATIRNVAVTNSSATITGSATGYAGGLVGLVSANATINNSFSTADLRNQLTSGTAYLGGIVAGTTNRASLKITNTYFNGASYGTLNSNSIIENMAIGTTTITSSYGILTKVQTSGTTYHYQIKYKEGATNKSEAQANPNSKAAAENAIKNISLTNNTFVSDSKTESDPLLHMDNNWFKTSSDTMPELRGVGNRYIAIKGLETSTSYSDFYKNADEAGTALNNSGKAVGGRANIGYAPGVELILSHPDKTWSTIKLYKGIAGLDTRGTDETSSNRYLSTKSNNVQGRYDKNILYLEADAAFNTQGYFTVKFTTTTKIHKYNVSIHDLKNYNSTLTSLAGQLSVKVMSGEAYSSVSGAGTSISHNVWQNANNSVIFYATSATTLQFWAQANDTQYHGLVIANLEGGKYPTVGQLDAGTNTITAGVGVPLSPASSGRTERYIRLYVSDIYELNYIESENNDDNVHNIIFGGKTNYERAYSKASNVYISYGTLSFYTADGNAFLQKTDQELKLLTPYNGFYSKGFDFGGWQIKSEDGSKTTRVSDSLGMRTQGDPQYPREILLSTVTPNGTNINGKAARSVSALDLYGIWYESENTVTFSSFLNIDSSNTWNSEFFQGKMQTNELIWTETVASGVLFPIPVGGASVQLFYTTSDGEDLDFTNSTGIIQYIYTGQTISVQTGMDGYGYALKGLIIYNALWNNEEYFPTWEEGFNGGSVNATFATSHSLGKNLWYYEVDGTNPTYINHLHGDLHIMALYERNQSSIDVTIAPVEGLVGTDFAIFYEIFEITGAKIGEGTLTGDTGGTITGLKFLQTIKLSNLDNNPIYGFYNENSPVTWLEKGNTDMTNIGELVINYDSRTERPADGDWLISDFAQASGLEIGTITKNQYNVQIDVAFIPKAMSFNLHAGWLDGEELNVLPADYANLTGQTILNGTSVPIISNNLVKNFFAGAEFEISVPEQRDFKLVLESGKYKILVFHNGTQITNHGIQLEVVQSPNNGTNARYLIENFGGLSGSLEAYEIYLIAQKLSYTINITKSEGAAYGTVKVGDNEVTTLTNVGFNDENNIIFTANAGYKIKSLTLQNSKSISKAVGGDGYTLNLKLSDSDYEKLITTQTVTLEVEFEAKDSMYKIEHYIENFDGTFSIAKDGNGKDIIDIIKTNVKVGDTVSVSEDLKRNFTYWKYEFVNGKSVEQKVVGYVVSEDDPNITTLKVYYVLVEYTVVYNANTGTGTAPASHTVKLGGSFVVGANTFTKTGYNFKEWNKVASGGSTTSLAVGATVQATTDFLLLALSNKQIMLYAQWTGIIYTVEFAANGGEGTMASQTYTYGVAQSLRSNSFTKTGYSFGGWNTKTDGSGTSYSNAQSVSNLTSVQDSTVTLYAQWTANTVTVNYYPNLTGASLSFSTQTTKVGLAFGTMPTVTAPKGFTLIGWFTENKPNAALEEITSSSIVPTSSVVNLYAHWALATPTITIPNDWEFTSPFTGATLSALKIDLSTSATNAYVSNANTAAGIVYSYQWLKAGVVVSGETGATLRVRNVSDSGQYSVSVTAKHAIWDTIGKTNTSGEGKVTITPIGIDISTTLENGIISKVYDTNTTVPGVSTNGSSVITVSAKYDNANAGTSKTVTFDVKFASGTLAENYSVYYKNVIIPSSIVGGVKQAEFSFTDSTAQIKKSAFTLNIPSLSGKFTGFAHDIAPSAIIAPAVNSMLVSRGHELVGDLQTNDSVEKVYTAAQIVTSNLRVIVTASGVDVSSNYEITITGTYEIVEGDMKTLSIDKRGYFDKVGGGIEDAYTGTFSIMLGDIDISDSGPRKINGQNIIVKNDANSNIVSISVDAEFASVVTITASAYTVNVSSVATIAVPISWNITGLAEVRGAGVTFNFATLAAKEAISGVLTFQNYSTIIYSARITTDNIIEPQTVYNTTNGLTITHPTLSQKGLSFLGWFDSTQSTKQLVSTTWKGVGQFIVYADWELLSIDHQLRLDTQNTTNNISTTYDGLSHTLESFVVNKNEEGNISYTYSWTVPSENTVNVSSFSFKDAGSKSITLKVTAKLMVGETQRDEKEITQTITLSVARFNFIYQQTLEKVYDGTNIVKNGEESFVIAQIQLGSVIEELKVTGTYASKYAGENIALRLSFADYGGFKASNYQVANNAKGTITPRALKDVNLGTEEVNFKDFDNTPFIKTKEGTNLSSSLVSGNILQIVFRTKGVNAKVYNSDNDEIEIVSWQVFDGAVTITESYTFDPSELIAAVLIKTVQFNTSAIMLVTDTVEYTGSEHFIYANLSNLNGGVLPSGLTETYTWRIVGEEAYRNDTTKPKNAGSYEIFYTLSFADSNFQVVGANPLTANLTITKRQTTLVLEYTGDNAFLGQGIRTIDINETSTIRNKALITGHIMMGTVKTNSEMPGVYSQSSGLITDLQIFASAENVTDNYTIILEGGIEIVHYYFLRFNANSGEGNMADQKIHWGQNLAISTNAFTRDGYTFANWNTQQDGSGTSYSNRALVKNLGNHNQIINLYAIWTPAQTQYFVEHYLPDLEGVYSVTPTSRDMRELVTENVLEYEFVTGVAPYLNVKVYANQAAKERDESLNSYVITNNFTGFSLTDTGFSLTAEQRKVLTGVITPQSTGALTLKIYYERNNYKLTLRKNTDYNGEVSEDFYPLFEQLVSEPAKPTRTGVIFDGWYLNYQGSNETKVVWPYKMPAENIVIWAKYIAETNTQINIHIYEQKTNGEYDQTPTSTSVALGTTDTTAKVDIITENGQAISVIVNMYENGEFKKELQVLNASRTGFYLDLVKTGTPEGTISALETLVLSVYYAREEYTYTKVFHNGEPDESTTALYGKTILKPANPSFQGWKFDGWFLNYDEATNTYSGEVMVWSFGISEDLTLHAKWEARTDTALKVSIYLEGLNGTYSLTPNEVLNLTGTTGLTAKFEIEEVEGEIAYKVNFYESTYLRASLNAPALYGFTLNESHEESHLENLVVNDGSGAIKAYFTRNSYAYTLVYGQGEDNGTLVRKYEYLTAESEVSPPVVIGYRFAGWFLEFDGISEYTNPVSFPHKLQKDTTFYARWYGEETFATLEIYLANENNDFPSIHSSTKTIDSKDELELKVGQTVKLELEQGDNKWKLFVYDEDTGDLTGLVFDIELEGYIFSKADTLFVETVIEEEGKTKIQLYYILAEFTFIAEIDSDDQDYEDQQVKFKQKPIMPVVNSKLGWVFAGWFRNEELTTAFNLEVFEMPAQSVTIYAKWTRATNIKYIVEYHLQNLDNPNHYTIVDEVEFEGTTFNVVKVEEGVLKTYDQDGTTYLFEKGLNTYIGFTFDPLQASELTTIIAKEGTGLIQIYYSRNTYTITFKHNNSTADEVKTNILYQALVQKDMPARLGYDFMGWYYDEGLLTIAPWEISTENSLVWEYIMEPINQIMYAKWQARTDTEYVIEYWAQDPNDEEVFNLAHSETKTGMTDSTVEIILLTFDGLRFDESDTRNVLTGTIIATDNESLRLVLKAYYIRNIYNITFHGNGHDAEEMPAQEFKFGQTITLDENLFVRNGFTFYGWTRTENSLLRTYTDGQTITLSDVGDFNLYALWTINNATSHSLTKTPDITQIYYGDKVVLTANIVHGAAANSTIKYTWYKDGIKIAHNQQTLEILQINQSGTYKVEIHLEANITKGAIYKDIFVTTQEQTVSMAQRQVRLVISGDSYQYSGLAQRPVASLQYIIDEDNGIFAPTESIIMPNFSVQIRRGVSILTESKDAGNYKLVVSVVEDSNFTLIGTSEFDYAITKLSWDISGDIAQGEFSKMYASQTNPVLEKVLTNPITGESFTINFTREDVETVGYHNLMLGANTAVKVNYELELIEENLGFRIDPATSGESGTIEFISTKNFEKIYDGTQPDLKGLVAFAIANLRLERGGTILSAEFALENPSANAGEYNIILISANTIEYGSNIKLANYGYRFIIQQKTLEYQPSTLNKVYDANTQISGVGVIGVIEKDLLSLAIEANFTNAEVGENKLVTFTLSGGAASNYKLGSSFSGVNGEITPREVEVLISNNEVNYGTSQSALGLTYQIFGKDTDTGLFTLAVDASQVSGEIAIVGAGSKLTVGTYTIGIGSLAVSNNYIITSTQTGMLTVQKIEVTATSDWKKVFDGTLKYNDAITLFGVLEGDEVFAHAQFNSEELGVQTLEIEIYGADAENYELANTMATGEITHKTVIAVFDYNFPVDAETHSPISETELSLLYGETIATSGHIVLPMPTASGYVFVGWFDENNVKYTPNTVIEPSIWEVSENEKTLTARWTEGELTLTVGIVTTSTTAYFVENMKAPSSITSGTVLIDSQSILTNGHIQVVFFKNNLVLEAVPSANYEFDGWYLTAGMAELKIQADGNFMPVGNQLSFTIKNNLELFARFRLKASQVEINLNANEDLVSLDQAFAEGWAQQEQNGRLTAITKEFDLGTIVSLPMLNQVLRDGYEFAGWFTNENPETLITSVEVATAIVVYAKWVPITYIATFKADTGNEAEELLNSDKGKFNSNNQTTLVEYVDYNTEIGNIEIPTRLRYVFDGWYDNPEFEGEEITAQAIYKYLENATFFAKWKAAEYTITINVKPSASGEVVVVQDNGISMVDTVEIGGVKQIKITLLSTVELALYIKATQGYTRTYNFDTLIENQDFVFVVNGEANSNFNISRFKEDLTLNIHFKANLNTVEILTTDTSKGQFNVNLNAFLPEEDRNQAINDMARIEETFENEQQRTLVYVFTGEEITITPIAKQGYLFEKIEQESGQISLLIDAEDIIIKEINNNAALSLVFGAKENTILINSIWDITKAEPNSNAGSFAVSVIDQDDDVRVVESNNNGRNNELSVKAKTGEAIVITLQAGYGFKISQDTAQYNYVKELLADAFDGFLDFSELESGIIKLSGFNSDGLLSFGFERDLYEFSIVLAVRDKDGNLNFVSDNEIAQLNISNTADGTKNEKSAYYYQTQMSVEIVLGEGYDFVGWFNQLMLNKSLSSQTQFNEFELSENTVLVAVVKQKTYIVEYEIIGKGSLEAQSKYFEVTHGDSLATITAIPALGYEFARWESFNFETEIWEIDSFSETRQDQNIKQNLRIRAVFEPKQITISVKTQVILEIDNTGNYIYGTPSVNIGYVESIEPFQSGIQFEVLTQTDDVVTLAAFVQEGYVLSDWLVEAGKFATVTQVGDKLHITISGFYEDLEIIALFETKKNIFQIGILSKLDDNFSFNIGATKAAAGMIEIDPTKIIETEKYKAYLVAGARTGQTFTVQFKIFNGYKVLTEENNIEKPLVAIKFEGSSTLKFIDTAIIDYYNDNQYFAVVTAEVDMFSTGGQIVLFVEAQEYSVLFEKTQFEEKYITLTLESEIAQALSAEDYLIPRRDGWTFKGWFTNEKPGEMKYQLINANGSQVGDWEPSISRVYAEWEKNVITINISYSPGQSAQDGVLYFSDDPTQLKDRDRYVSFEYYVGSEIIFIAAPGKNGYAFSHWEYGDEIVSNSLRFDLFLPSNAATGTRTYKIVYAVSVSVRANAGGTATIDETNQVYLIKDQTATLVAIPGEYYDFLHWKNETTGEIISTSSTYEIGYFNTPTIIVAEFIGKLVEVRVVMQVNGGTVTGWTVDGLEPYMEGSKTYARYLQTLKLNQSREEGYEIYGWLVNGNINSFSDNADPIRNPKAFSYQITRADVERGYVTIEPVYRYRELVYQIIFPSESAIVKVGETEISSPKGYATNYFSNIEFTFQTKQRYQFVSITITIGSTTTTLSSQSYITRNGENYEVSFPSNFFLLGQTSQAVRINFEKLYWIDARVPFEGIGTEENPYIITSAEQFAYMAYLINKKVSVDGLNKIEYASGYYLLASSIDFGDRFWIPIGTEENPFNGTIRLDYARQNIFHDKEYEVTKYDGLFGYVTSNAKFLIKEIEIRKGIIIISSVVVALGGVAAAFVIAGRLKRKKMVEISRVLPTDRVVTRKKRDASSKKKR